MKTATEKATLEYVVTVLRGFTENVAITFEHTGKAVDDADLRGDLIEHFRQAIAEWFDVNAMSVATREEYATSARGEQ